jgi:putative phage-type endonuclease
VPQTSEVRKQWLQERRQGIGGTDASAILGVNPWVSAHDVWLDKIGASRERERSEAMWWGTELEALIARRYQEETGNTLWNPQRIYQHHDHPILIATPDRLLVPDGPVIKAGLECKTASAFKAHEWGPVGSDEIPDEYLVQCHHYMNVLRVATWEVAVLLGGQDFRVYRIERDMKLQSAMTERLAEWWQKYIVDGAEPPLTGHAAEREWLRSRFPRDSAPVVAADRVAEQWAATLAVSLEAFEVVEYQVEEARNNLKRIIGENAGVESAAFRVLWKLSKGRRSVDWEAMARELAHDIAGELATSPTEQEEITRSEIERGIEKHTKQTEGSRRFTFTDLRGKDR